MIDAISWIGLYFAPGFGFAWIWCYAQWRDSIDDGDEPPWPIETGHPVAICAAILAISCVLWPVFAIGLPLYLLHEAWAEMRAKAQNVRDLREQSGADQRDEAGRRE
jgi:hypothetical protein